MVNNKFDQIALEEIKFQCRTFTEMQTSEDKIIHGMARLMLELVSEYERASSVIGEFKDEVSALRSSLESRRIFTDQIEKELKSDVSRTEYDLFNLKFATKKLLDALYFYSAASASQRAADGDTANKAIVEFNKSQPHILNP